MSALYVIDGFSMAYRGHFALMRNPVMTSTGINTSSILVFGNVLMGLLEREKPEYLVVVFDTPEPTFRHKAYADYKAGRDAMPDDLAVAIPRIHDLVDALQIATLQAPGWEADDLAATLAHQAEAEGIDTYLVTSDKDYEQLVTDRTRVCRPGGSGEQYQVLGVEEVLEKWQIERVEQVVDILALMGDKVDNVPGIPGIGEKTAQKLINQFGTVENLLASTEELKGKQKERVETHADDARMSKELIILHREVPVEFAWEDLRAQPPDLEKTKALCAELELRTLAERILGKGVSLEPERTYRHLEDVPHDYQLVTTEAAMQALAAELEEQPCVCLDLETTSLDVKRCAILGVAFSYSAGTAYYADWDAVGEDAMLSVLERLLVRTDLELVGLSLKYDLGALRWRGLQAHCTLFDVYLAAYVCLPEQRRGLDDLAKDLMDYEPIPIEALIGEKGDDQGTLSEVPVERVCEYAAEDADITWQLAELLRPRLKEDEGWQRVFYEVECPLVPVLVDMEFEGVRLDAAQLDGLKAHLSDEIQRARMRVNELAGEEVDLNSNRQIGEILFDKLKLDPRARRTAKTKQYSTREEILRRLEGRHEIVGQILHYRTCAKLLSNYVSQLPGAIHEPTGRVHTQYNQASIVTGRIQSDHPNLQVIPVRTELGRRIRGAFTARDEDHLLLSADYSQIELRIAAELSGDVHMRTTFEEDADIHAATAAKIHGVDLGDVTDEMRRTAKTVNFGIIYGISPFGLGERLNISRVAAKELIDQYFAEYPGIESYIEETLTFAREHGYVQTMLGRRRYVRDINARNNTQRQAAERNAINSRIQGTGADMIKLAMRIIHQRLTEGGFRTRMLLQVHDELVFDMPKNEADAVPGFIETAMRTALPLTVPVKVGMGSGPSWLDAH